MATRSRIGIKLKNDSILSVYHHWDGYPEGLGKYLVENYNTRQLVAELIDGGDMSTCMVDADEEIEYYSKRGESEYEPALSDDLAYFISLTRECGGEYAYVFANGMWECYITTTWNSTYGERIELYTVPA